MGQEPNSQIPQRMRFIPLWLLIAAAMLYAPFVACNILCTESHLVMEYPGIHLGGGQQELYSGRFDVLSSHELWVRYPTKEPIALHTITRTEALSLLPKSPSDRSSGEAGPSDRLFFDGISLKYQGNVLKEVTFGRGGNAKYSNRKGGEYIRFPITPAEVRKAWGKPIRERHERTTRRFVYN